MGQSTTIIARVAAAFLALAALATGARSIFVGLGADAIPLIDNTHRFYAGIWFGVGIALAYCIFRFEQSTLLLRGLMLMIFMGGVARLAGLLEYDPTREMVIPIVIEFVLPPVIVWAQAKAAATQPA